MSELEQSSRSWWNSFYYLSEASLPVSISSRDALLSDIHNLPSIKETIWCTQKAMAVLYVLMLLCQRKKYVLMLLCLKKNICWRSIICLLLCLKINPRKHLCLLRKARSFHFHHFTAKLWKKGENENHPSTKKGNVKNCNL